MRVSVKYCLHVPARLVQSQFVSEVLCFGISSLQNAVSSVYQNILIIFLCCVGGGCLEAGSQLWQAVCYPTGSDPRPQHSPAVFHG